MARYSTPVSNLLARLQAHNATGHLLDGWKVVILPVKEVDGQSDVAPGILRVKLPMIREKTHEQMAIVAGGTISMELKVTTWRENGIVAHIQAVEKVMDAFDLNGSTLDLLLGASLAKPIEVTTEGQPYIPEDSALSMNTDLKVTMTPKACASGGRHL